MKYYEIKIIIEGPELGEEKTAEIYLDLLSDEIEMSLEAVKTQIKEKHPELEIKIAM